VIQKKNQVNPRGAQGLESGLETPRNSIKTSEVIKLSGAQQERGAKGSRTQKNADIEMTETD